jgi:acetyl esterase/lipase
LFGQLAGVGPLLVFSGTRDVLNPQARNLLERSSLAGAAVELVEAAGLIHDYPLLPIPEARCAVDYMVGFLAR